ncbi:DEAD-box ATP-dependent RNA helicase 28 [Porphyridium purpureum]|uniref:DEAD-box ATP-dependent RNA helicase 28 n=1 Tax=Porphyridium purpureum TaxID=35688 RepID=A0A5J4Z161_PORPP|nr:DEAD-box ATP-dependent RNA helicase 28 [Porphyridium purpureum]|eukprot:POR1375..scf208_2
MATAAVARASAEAAHATVLATAAAAAAMTYKEVDGFVVLPELGAGGNESDHSVSSRSDAGSDGSQAPDELAFAEADDPVLLKAWDLTQAKQWALPVSAKQSTVDEKIQRALNGSDAAAKRRKRPASEDEDPAHAPTDSEEDTTSSGGESEDDSESGSDRSESESQSDSDDAGEADEAPLKHKQNTGLSRADHVTTAQTEGSGAQSDAEQDTEPHDAFRERYKRPEHLLAEAKKQMQKRRSFADLKMSKPLLKAIELMGWHVPTPIQLKTLPIALEGRDVCGSAVTGSGKTGAFALPIIERLIQLNQASKGARANMLATRVIMLLPSRELAIQCHAVVSSLLKFTALRAALTVGGLSSKEQEVQLRSKPDIVVATPGRLIDHLRNTQGFSLEDVEVLVIDEADRMLEMGFKDEMDELLRFLPKKRQTLLFSATLTGQVEWLVNMSLDNPIRIAADPIMDVASSLDQEFVRIRGKNEQNRDAILLALVSRSFRTKTIIFFAQKHKAHRFKILFGLFGLKAGELHGNLAQVQRLESLENFRDGNVDFLLCTDLAARGLDIVGIETVINYDMPRTVKEYVHRVGRTARAGRGGRAVSLIMDSERKLLNDIHKRALEKLTQRTVPVSVTNKWRERIDAAGAQLAEVLREERDEKQLRLAEMEVAKASNLMVHQEEIASRPARTWFQTKKQKDEVRSLTKQHALTRGAPASASGKSSDGKSSVGGGSKNGANVSDKKLKKIERGKRQREEARKEELAQREHDFSLQRKAKKARAPTGNSDRKLRKR